MIPDDPNQHYHRVVMSRSPYAIPLRPDYSAARRPSDCLARAALVKARSFIDETGDDRVAADSYPDDEPLRLVLRGAVVPATTTTTGFAAELAQNAVPDHFFTLAPLSAGSPLLRSSLLLNFNRSGVIPVPGLVVDATHIGFVAQGAAIPVRQFSLSEVPLVPSKFAVIISTTRELFDMSQPTAESVIRQLLRESTALALDAALFSDVALDAIRPAGLRNGVVATAATAGGGLEAMVQDLAGLAEAIAPVAGSQIAFVAAPGEAVKIQLRSTRELPFPVLASSALDPGVVLAVATNALACAMDRNVKFDVSNQAALHFEDTPLAIGTAGSPATVAAPTRSMFQSDLIAIKATFTLSWGLRVSGALAWTTGVTW